MGSLRQLKLVEKKTDGGAKTALIVPEEVMWILKQDKIVNTK